MVLQGVIGFAVLLLVGFVAWRRAWMGGVLLVALALLLVFLLSTAGDAPRPYIVMALVGLCLAAPVVLVQLWLRVRRQGIVQPVSDVGLE